MSIKVQTMVWDRYPGEDHGVPHGLFHTALPLKYTGKPYEGINEGRFSKRSRQIQERIAAQIEREQRLAESAAWAGKAIRAMVDAGRAAA